MVSRWIKLKLITFDLSWFGVKQYNKNKQFLITVFLVKETEIIIGRLGGYETLSVKSKCLR